MMNPLDMPGPDFLTLALSLMAASGLLASALRWWMRQPGHAALYSTRNLAPYEAAALRSPQAVIDAALASLSHQGLLKPNQYTFDTVGTLPRNAPLVERLVYESMQENKTRPAQLLKRAEPAIQQLRATLQERGWLVDEPWSWMAHWLPMLPFLGVLLMCVSKVMVGLERDKPVFFLVILCIIGTGACISGFREVWRSRAGDAALRRLIADQEPLKLTAQAAQSPSALSNRDVALAVGLYGLTAVGYSEFSDVRRALASTGYTSSSSSISSSDSESGIGDVGGSGGGDSSCGGGGGCGGCGGGGD